MWRVHGERAGRAKVHHFHQNGCLLLPGPRNSEAWCYIFIIVKRTCGPITLPRRGDARMVSAVLKRSASHTYADGWWCIIEKWMILLCLGDGDVWMCNVVFLRKFFEWNENFFTKLHSICVKKVLLGQSSTLNRPWLYRVVTTIFNAPRTEVFALLKTSHFVRREFFWENFKSAAWKRSRFTFFFVLHNRVITRKIKFRFRNRLGEHDI